jgi:hypothetical protein
LRRSPTDCACARAFSSVARSIESFIWLPPADPLKGRRIYPVPTGSQVFVGTVEGFAGAVKSGPLS